MLVILLVVALLIVVCENNKTQAQSLVVGGAALAQSLQKTNKTAPTPVRPGNVLIVDTLNVLSDWTYQKYAKAVRGYRPDLFLGDLKGFLPQFIGHVQKQHPHVERLVFVLKNMRSAQDVPAQDPALDALLRRVTKKYSRSQDGTTTPVLVVEFHVAVYEKKHPRQIWNSRAMHHMRARDDILAMHLHMNQHGSTLVSKDKFRDSASFSNTPEFTHLMYMMGHAPARAKFQPSDHNFRSARPRRLEIDAIDFYKGKTVTGVRHVRL